MKKRTLALILALALLMTSLVYADMLDEQPVPDAEAQTEISDPEQLPPPASEDHAEESGEQPDSQTELETPDEPDANEPEASEEPEETEEPDQETPDVPEETEEPAFAAQVKVELKNDGLLYEGDTVTLVAVVENANADYTVRWEYYDVAASEEAKAEIWTALFTGKEYSFTLDKENALLTYRAVVNDLIVCEYRLPEVLERPAQDDPTSDEGETGDVEEPESPALNPDRAISIHIDGWNGEALHVGDEITLVAELTGYDNAVYTIQWQTSKDRETWTDVDGATEARYTMTVTKDNARDLWRVVVVITDLAETAA